MCFFQIFDPVRYDNWVHKCPKCKEHMSSKGSVPPWVARALAGMTGYLCYKQFGCDNPTCGKLLRSAHATSTRKGKPRKPQT